MQQIHRSWVEIDLGALRRNLRRVRGLIGSGVKLFAVCKADGYGCGAAAVARVAAEEGADALATGSLEDVAAVRAAGVRLPILLYPSTVPAEAAALVELDVTVTIHDAAGLAAFERLARPLRAFIKLDCGFGRLGFGPAEWPELFERCARLAHLRIAGLYAHVDAPDDEASLGIQSDLFAEGARAAEAAGLTGFERMLASSRVLLCGRAYDHTAVNPGRLLYGMMEPPWDTRLPVEPVVRAVRSRIIQVKDIAAGAGLGYGATAARGAVRTAVLSSGFADGFGHLPPGGSVLIGGRRAPVIGRRGFEHTVVDVTDIPAATVGGEAVLLGPQGDATIDPVALARDLRLPLLELLPRLARSLPRIYLDESTSTGKGVPA
jgi:alanine racemase